MIISSSAFVPPRSHWQQCSHSAATRKAITQSLNSVAAVNRETQSKVASSNEVLREFRVLTEISETFDEVLSNGRVEKSVTFESSLVIYCSCRKERTKTVPKTSVSCVTLAASMRPVFQTASIGDVYRG